MIPSSHADSTPASQISGQSQPLNILCRSISQWDWVVMLFLLPAILYFSPELIFIVLVFPILMIIRRIGVGHYVPPTPINGSLWLMLVMIGVSIYATPDILFSLRKVVGLTYGIFLFWSISTTIQQNPKHFWIAIGLLALGGWAVVALGLIAGDLQAKIPLLFPVMERLYQFYAFLPAVARSINPNEIGGALTWVVPLACAILYGLLFYPSRHASALQFLLLSVATASTFLFVGMLVLTQSRGALAGTGIALFCMLLLLSRQTRRLTLFLSLLLTMVFAFFFSRTGFSDGLIRLGEITGITLNPLGSPEVGIYSISGRLEIWSRALFALQDFPITGMGMNMFRRLVHVFYPLFIVSPDTDIAHAHNHLLQAGLDLGIPGLIAYLALWFGLATSLWQTWQRSEPDSWPRLLSLGIAGSLLAYFLYGITDAIALGARPGFIFWILAAAAIGLQSSSKSATADSTEQT